MSVIRTFIAVPIVVIGILLMCLGSWAGGSLVQRSVDRSDNYGLPEPAQIEVQGISVDHWPIGAKDEDLPPPILTRHVYKREGDKMVYAGRIE